MRSSDERVDRAMSGARMAMCGLPNGGRMDALSGWWSCAMGCFAVCIGTARKKKRTACVMQAVRR
jgi:hypothetical protein